ncbi:MAG: beta-N-acetylhexosaminidase [Chelatococcus sp.]|uniref:beta-N-acetylhexosaminidase n=1 Tax=Chelatococcus sp. TaxID=1953771 RepID=UPI0025C18D0B|nr:beta-N-acetylhexosaminidase [Chelatococcus sp.]MBX3537826.1 beta-N-acetylhexosaminidase [Chelatococcus sp.]
MTRAMIAGCSGLSLTAEEARFFRDADPWGFILFRRNVDTPDQVRALTAALREAVGRADAPILIDQEGGRVQRLRPPHWPDYPPGRAFGELYERDEAFGREIARLGARLIAHDLLSVGVTVDCMPVLDIPIPGASSVIGDRAYGSQPRLVADLGRAVADGLMAGGVLPVIKHVPGHGRAGVDSHHELPVVDVALAELEMCDFVPFRLLSDLPLAMTAHVVYKAIDERHPATTSAVIISRVIRQAIGFGGLLMSDDLSMNALSGTAEERARASLNGGCDVVLHCNGDLDEMRRVAAEVPLLAGEAEARAAAALRATAGGPEPFDPVEGMACLNLALATAARGAEG